MAHTRPAAPPRCRRRSLRRLPRRRRRGRPPLRQTALRPPAAWGTENQPVNQSISQPVNQSTSCLESGGWKSRRQLQPAGRRGPRRFMQACATQQKEQKVEDCGAACTPPLRWAAGPHDVKSGGQGDGQAHAHLVVRVLDAAAALRPGRQRQAARGALLGHGRRGGRQADALQGCTGRGSRTEMGGGWDGTRATGRWRGGKEQGATIASCRGTCQCSPPEVPAAHLMRRIAPIAS